MEISNLVANREWEALRRKHDPFEVALTKDVKSGLTLFALALQTNNKPLLSLVLHPKDYEFSESKSYAMFDSLDDMMKRDPKVVQLLKQVEFKMWMFLEAAVLENDVPWMKMLLDVAGLDMNDTDGWDITPITNAAKDSTKSDMFNLLFERGANLNTSPCPLHVSKDPQVLDKVLARGISVDVHANGQDKTVTGMSCFTPLQHAANCGTSEQVRMLLDRGASTTIEATNGRGTALDIARNRNKRDGSRDKIIAMLTKRQRT